MKFFRLRETPVENLTFLAMMVAFDAIVALIAALLPFSAIFVTLLCPLTAAAVCLFCKKRYIPLFLAAGIGICFAVTAWDFLNTIFYIVPALFTGTLYGFLWRLKVPTSLNLFAVSLVSLVFFYCSLLLIKGLFEQDMVNVLLTFIGRGGDEAGQIIFPMFVFGYSAAQTAIMHGFLLYELRRIGFEEAEENIMPKIYPWLASAFLAGGLILGIFYPKAGYFLFGLGLFWAVFCFVSLYPKVHPLLIGLFIAFGFGGILLFAGLMSSMPKYSGLLLFAAPIALCAVASFFNPLLLKTKRNDLSGETEETDD